LSVVVSATAFCFARCDSFRLAKSTAATTTAITIVNLYSIYSHIQT